MLKVPEVAAILRVCDRTVYRMLARGELPFVRAGRSLRIPEYAVRPQALPESAAA